MKVNPAPKAKAFRLSFSQSDFHSRNTRIPQTALPAKRHRKSILTAPCLPYLIAFFVPIFVMLIIFAGKSIFPFGDRSFLRTDLYHQYAPFFQEYKDKLSGFDSLFYTWDIGLGTNFLALFAYYLSSPLNILLIFCPRTYVIEFITYGIVLRMALSSLSLTYYLNNRSHTHRIGASFFGIFYGLSGYMAAYSWNIMWLDCLVLFPLVILGLERLVKEDRCILYCVSLALCIFSNYYISIMICLSLILYFAVQLILVRDENFNYPKKVLNFSLYSLLAGGLAAIVLIPEIAALSTTASGNFSFPTKYSSYFSIFDMISRHLMLVNVETGLDHWPNIYCGVAILLLFPLYLTSRRISFREKLAYSFLLLFFLLSFSLNILNFIWHGFHYPNSLPCRQSFIYIFLLLSMGFEGYRDIRRRKSKELLICLAVAVAFVILAEKLGAEYTGETDDDYYMWFSFYASIGFLLLYGGLFQVLIHAKKLWRGVLLVAALAAVIIESTVNMAYTSVTTINRPGYVRDDESVRTIVASIEEREGNDFFRVEKVSNRTKNDGAWLDYHSPSIFSSTAYADLTAIYKKFGLESSTNAYGTTGSSWISNMFLGVKYSLAFSELEEDEFRKLYMKVDNSYMYENTYALPLAYMVDNTLSEAWNTTATNPADNWNSLAQALGVRDSLFLLQEKVDNNNTNSVTVTTSDAGYVYLYVNRSGPDDVQVSYEDFSKKYENLNRSYFIDLKPLGKGTVITVANAENNSSKTVNVSAYVLNPDALEEIYEILSREPLAISHYNSTEISGTVTSVRDGTMLTSIPYDAGWTAYVDGKPVATASFEDAFLSFPVDAGTHSVELKYTPRGFWPGLLISLTSLLLLGLITLLKRQWKISQARRLSADERSSEELGNWNMIEELDSIIYDVPEENGEKVQRTGPDTEPEAHSKKERED